MFILLNEQELHVQVVCGILEDYEPSENIEEINERVSELRDKVNSFRKEYEPELEEIKKLINEENSKYMNK
jgi:uncharacterized coiled-coil DUF342 family protein